MNKLYRVTVLIGPRGAHSHNRFRRVVLASAETQRQAEGLARGFALTNADLGLIRPGKDWTATAAETECLLATPDPYLAFARA